MNTITQPTAVNKPVVDYEYIHSCHTEDKRDGSTNDAVFIKRHKHTQQPDGTWNKETEYVMKENLQRSFWLTKKSKRKHEFKIEAEELGNLDHYVSTQRMLTKNICRKLGRPWTPQTRLAEVFRSPFVYGCDPDINAIVKMEYNKRRKREEKTLLTYAVQDTEFDMNGNLGMIIFSMSFKEKAYQVVLRDWTNPGETEQEYIDFINNELPEIKSRNIKLELDFVDTMAEGIVKMYQKANEWSPDIIGFWNINYDMTIIENILKDAGIDPADVFSHPSVPAHYRRFEFKRGSLTKTKDDGTSRPLEVSEQWHTVYCTAPFYFIDPASVFRGLRKMKSEASYSLEYLTTKFLGQGKYKVDHPLLNGIPEGTAKWHMVMQKHFKKEYCAYGLIDCIRVEEFEECEKIQDITLKLPLLVSDSHFKDFSSNPRKLTDAFHHFALENGLVMSTTSDRMKTKLDEMVVGKDLWINIVDPSQLEDIGIQLCDSNMFLTSRTTIHNFDLDLISAYPKIGSLLGLCRKNTVFEITKLQGIDSHRHRYICVNLTGGDANAVINTKELYKLDGLEELHIKFAKAHGLEPRMS